MTFRHYNAQNILLHCQARRFRRLGSRFEDSGASAKSGISQTGPCMNPRLGDCDILPTVEPLH